MADCRNFKPNNNKDTSYFALSLSMALVREHQRFLRYVFAVQYNGTPFLGFTYQGQDGENCINKQGIDLRGLYSVEGKIRLALNSLVNQKGKVANNLDANGCDGKEIGNGDDDNFENFQVSSRTDRGVHAWKNTFHVDIRPRSSSQQPLQSHQLLRGLNYFLRRQSSIFTQHRELIQGANTKSNLSIQPPPILTGNEIRILSCKAAPLELIENKHYDPDQIMINDDVSMLQPSHISWNARFTALRRTYIYRILSHSLPQHFNLDHDTDGVTKQLDTDFMEEFGVPFEDNWSWRVIHENPELNIAEMRAASKILTGTHDFTSFRGKNCVRSSPIVTIEKINIDSTPLQPDIIGLYPNHNVNAKIVTITIQGTAFLYRQMRNLVGCLVEVGKNRLNANDVKEILLGRDRRKAGVAAPAHGLYLANVEHHNLII